jgi:hypothetical protein
MKVGVPWILASLHLLLDASVEILQRLLVGHAGVELVFAHAGRLGHGAAGSLAELSPVWKISSASV